jgi:hypothetical protein
MPYQNETVEVDLAEDKWVEAFEILPTARDVVHHVIVQVLEKDAPKANIGDGAGGFWAAYVPGNGARVFPAGFARRLKAGSKLHFQIHYAPNGHAVEDRMRIGLVFAKVAPQFEVQSIGVAKRDLMIPPRAANHVEIKEQTVPTDMNVMSFMPHMHVRGKAFKYEVFFRDGRQETLLEIPHYDFNWQLSYDLKQPKLLPKGCRIRLTGTFDNGEGNKANPDPSQTVKWGPQTSDEMMIGYFEVFTPVKSTPKTN